jgi:hypothetical protein
MLSAVAVQAVLTQTTEFTTQVAVVAVLELYLKL